MTNVEKMSSIAGGLVLAVLLGVGIKASLEVNNKNFTQRLEQKSSIFDEFKKPQNKVPELFSEDEYNFVVKSTAIQISKINLTSEMSYLIFLDKLYLGYLMSFMGDAQDAVKNIPTDYPEGSVVAIDFDQAKEIYEKVSDDYKNTIGNPSKSYVENPNSKKDVIESNMKVMEFLLKSPSSKNVFLKGLNDYYSFFKYPEERERLLNNPSADLCTMMDVMPELVGLPKDYCGK